VCVCVCAVPAAVRLPQVDVPPALYPPISIMEYAASEPQKAMAAQLQYLAARSRAGGVSAVRDVCADSSALPAELKTLLARGSLASLRSPHTGARKRGKTAAPLSALSAGDEADEGDPFPPFRPSKRGRQISFSETLEDGDAKEGEVGGCAPVARGGARVRGVRAGHAHGRVRVLVLVLVWGTRTGACVCLCLCLCGARARARACVCACVGARAQ
jgi:hypothetical protein